MYSLALDSLRRSEKKQNNNSNNNSYIRAPHRSRSPFPKTVTVSDISCSYSSSYDDDDEEVVDFQNANAAPTPAFRTEFLRFDVDDDDDESETSRLVVDSGLVDGGLMTTTGPTKTMATTSPKTPSSRRLNQVQGKIRQSLDGMKRAVTQLSVKKRGRRKGDLEYVEKLASPSFSFETLTFSSSDNEGTAEISSNGSDLHLSSSSSQQQPSTLFRTDYFADEDDEEPLLRNNGMASSRTCGGLGLKKIRNSLLKLRHSRRARKHARDEFGGGLFHDDYPPPPKPTRFVALEGY